MLLIRAEKTQEILAGRAIPVRFLREGLRPVFLMGDRFKEVSSSYLFVHTQKKDIPKKTISYFDKEKA